MDVNYIGMLQEYCQRRYLALPEYQTLPHSGPPHSPQFQSQVRVDGKCFTSEASYPRIKQAEQSAARVACEALNPRNRNLTIRRSHSPQTIVHHHIRHLVLTTISTSHSPPRNSMKHMPPQHADCEEFIIDIIRSGGGRIRKIWPPDEHGRYQFEITGTYRYCENVHRRHRKNHIYFMVDPIKKIYFQKCHDPQCADFQSTIKSMSTNQNRASIYNSIHPKRLKREIE